MSEIEQITHPDPETVRRLVKIWESAVRATHDFLTPADIEALRPDVTAALEQVGSLYGWRSEDGSLRGFLGVQDGKIEMLFVDARMRGKGVGKRLIRFALGDLGARLVDVNEQNIQGAGFYRHMGFRTVGRSELDGQGRPFPLLHMEYTPAQGRIS